ncbi:hypothetical protein ACFFLM_02735 [Deinococcus oregonensis]|uniref:Uncharacterized protein n=1 Tax=Deinococcus oregonensis TaxID=1805970 RepID=A0ABV6ATR6_9DEIO
MPYDTRRSLPLFADWEAWVDTNQVSCLVEGPGVEGACQKTSDVRDILEQLAGKLRLVMRALSPALLELPPEPDSGHHAAQRPSPPEDGFQADLGNWLEPNPGFRGHAKDLPTELEALGFRAGCWIALFW